MRVVKRLHFDYRLLLVLIGFHRSSVLFAILAVVNVPSSCNFQAITVLSQCRRFVKFTTNIYQYLPVKLPSCAKVRFTGTNLSTHQAGIGDERRVRMTPVSKWIALNALDLNLTAVALQFGAVEGNPIMRLSGVDSVVEIALWKVFFVFGTLVLLEVLARPGILRSDIVLSVTNVGMIVICVWNAFILQIGAAGLL